MERRRRLFLVNNQSGSSDELSASASITAIDGTSMTLTIITSQPLNSTTDKIGFNALQGTISDIPTAAEILSSGVSFDTAAQDGTTHTLTIDWTGVTSIQTGLPSFVTTAGPTNANVLAFQPYVAVNAGQPEEEITFASAITPVTSATHGVPTGFTVPPAVGETGTLNNNIVVCPPDSIATFAWLEDGVANADTDTQYTAVEADIGVALATRVTVAGVAFTSTATQDVVAGYDADAQAVIDQWKVTTPALSTGWQDAIDDLVVAAKANGWWTPADGIYVFASDVAGNSLMNWKAPTGTAASAVNGPTFAAKQGYTGDTVGPKYIDTTIALNTGGLQFTQDINGTAAYVRLNGTVGSAVYAGTNANNHSMTSASVGSNRSNSGTNFPISTNNNNAVVKALIRTGNAAHAYYVGSSATAADSGTTVAAALGTETMRFLQSNLRGGSTSQLSLGWFGGSLTGAQIVSMQTDVAAFLTAVSGL